MRKDNQERGFPEVTVWPPPTFDIKFEMLIWYWTRRREIYVSTHVLLIGFANQCIKYILNSNLSNLICIIICVCYTLCEVYTVSQIIIIILGDKNLSGGGRCMRCVARIWMAISGAGFITKYIVLKVTFWQVRGLAGVYSRKP